MRVTEERDGEIWIGLAVGWRDDVSRSLRHPELRFRRGPGGPDGAVVRRQMGHAPLLSQAHGALLHGLVSAASRSRRRRRLENVAGGQEAHPRRRNRRRTRRRELRRPRESRERSCSAWTPRGLHLRERESEGELGNVQLVHADVNRLPFPDEFFDFINCDQVIHHTPDPPVTFENLREETEARRRDHDATSTRRRR